jgi:hypothetical protein
MTNPLHKYRNFSIILLFILLTQSCVPVKLDTPTALPTAQGAEPTSTETSPAPLATPTAPIENPTATATASASPSPFPKVTISAVKGNLFIRRGPDLAFNPIGVLYQDTSEEALARDVLSKWVQIKIPNSNKMGWVSIQTKYSQLTGEIKNLPEYMPTEWPVAAYLRNCTHHQMYVLPNEIVIPSSYEFPDNEIWIYPGTYTIRDIDVPGDPEVDTITVSEGSVVEIRDDGSGEHRKCP